MEMYKTTRNSHYLILRSIEDSRMMYPFVFFVVLLPLIHAKIQDSSIKIKGSVEEVTMSNLFPYIKENDTWLDVLDVHPGTQKEYTQVPYESITSKDENGKIVYHTRIRIQTRDPPPTSLEPVSDIVEEVPRPTEVLDEIPHSDVPLPDSESDSLPEVEATIEVEKSNRTEDFFPNPPAFTLSRLVRHTQ